MQLPSPTHPMFAQHDIGAPMHMQAYGVRGRRIDDLNTHRSPLLEEFRNDRIRSWELKVRDRAILLMTDCLTAFVRRRSMDTLSNLARTNMALDSSNNVSRRRPKTRNRLYLMR